MFLDFQECLGITAGIIESMMGVLGLAQMFEISKRVFGDTFIDRVY